VGRALYRTLLPQEPNFHGLYLALLDKLGDKKLTESLVATTHKYIRILLASDRIKTHTSERSLLKNLGTWCVSGRLAVPELGCHSAIHCLWHQEAILNRFRSSATCIALAASLTFLIEFSNGLCYASKAGQPDAGAQPGTTAQPPGCQGRHCRCL
jgi:CCR4-NOT transcription complex subunit 1 CAF1-binding domain